MFLTVATKSSNQSIHSQLPTKKAIATTTTCIGTSTFHRCLGLSPGCSSLLQVCYVLNASLSS